VSIIGEDSNSSNPLYAVDAERATLGAALLSADAAADIADIVTADDFTTAAHTGIFTAITALTTAGQPVDPVTVLSYLNTTGVLDRIGGAATVHTLVAATPSPASGTYYAEHVRDAALRRRIQAAGAKIQQLAASAGSEPALIADTAEHELLNATETRAHTTYTALADLLDPTIELIESNATKTVTGPIPPYHDLRTIIPELLPGQLIVIAARPSIGKSTIALDFVRHSAARNVPTALFSLEMSAQEIMTRYMSAESGTPMPRLLSGQLNDNDWEKVSSTVTASRSRPLYIDDSPNLSLMEIRSKSRRLKQRHNIKLLVVDYLQLMDTGLTRSMANRQEEVAFFSRSLKLLGKELDIPIIALSQLNRGPEQRQDKRPMISDMRESGSIEQDADVIMLLHREDFYDRTARPGELDVIVAKHRNGATGTTSVVFQGHLSRAVDMTTYVPNAT